jgi:hypothetical protein
MNIKEAPVINNPEKQKKLIDKKGQYKINFDEDSVEAPVINNPEIIGKNGQCEINFGENPVNNNQVKYIDRDSYITEEDIARTRRIHLDEEYATQEDLLEEKDNNKDDDIEKYWPKELKEKPEINFSEERKRIESIKRSSIYKELSGKDLTYEDKEKIVQVYRKLASLKSYIKRIIFEMFEKKYHDSPIDMENIDIKVIWDTVLETKETYPEYVQDISEYLNANRTLGSCMKKLKDGQIKKVHKKLKELYRSGSNSKELITQHKEYEEMLEILES